MGSSPPLGKFSIRQSEILGEKHLKILGKAEILGGMNSQILFEIENFVEISKSQDLLSFFKRWRCIHSA